MSKTSKIIFANINLVILSQSIVKKYGASYHTFALFGVINYPLTCLYEAYFIKNTEGLILRLISTLLCFILLLNKYWPQKFKAFLPLYWYMVIIFTVPFLTTYLLLKDNFSLGWLINFNIGVMIAILLLDSLTFIVVEAIGIILGFVFFYSLGNKIDSWPTDYYNTALFVYMFICVVILGTIFSKNKEIFNHFKEKSLSELNKYLEAKVEHRTIELEKALAVKTEFLNNMSHEIRTPIQGLTIISEALVKYWQQFDEQKKFELARQILKNSKRLTSLVGSLLDLAKINAGKILLDLQKLDLVLIIEELIDECNTLYMNSKKLKIVFQKDNEALFLIGDYERITQVLRNLLLNAIKFSPVGGIITVILTKSKMTYDNGNKVEAIHCIIKDAGIGIPDKELISIFTPFVQSSRTKTRAGGTGLGLAISHKIIEAHHGKIWAENNVDKGATFNFIIPLTQNEQMHNKTTSETDIKVINDLRSANILIIDDEDTCLMSMELLLFGSGYNLHKASGGYAGLEYLKEHHHEIDLILLDLMMPDIYGLNVLTEIKKDPEFAKIPVILQTGSSDNAEIERAFECGIITYIKKPYQRQNIMTEIDRVLDRYDL